MGVTIGPGWTELQRIRSFAYWIAVALVSRRTAPFDAWYCALVVSTPTRPSWDEMLMIEPPPAARIAGMAARVPRNTPVELTDIVRFQSSSVVSARSGP